MAVRVPGSRMAQIPAPPSGSPVDPRRPEPGGKAATKAPSDFKAAAARIASGQQDQMAQLQQLRSVIAQGGNPDLSSVGDVNIITSAGRTEDAQGRQRHQVERKTVNQLLAEMTSWSADEREEMQRALYAAGLFADRYYGENADEVHYGVLDTATRQAFSSLLAESLVDSSRPMTQILRDKQRDFSATGKTASGKKVESTARPGITGGGNFYDVSLSDPATLHKTADDVASAVLGRALTDEDKAKYANLIRGEEANRQNARNSAVEANQQQNFARSTAQADTNTAAEGGIVMPVNGGVQTGKFGEQRPGHTHAGIDLAVPEGTMIAAAMGGRVERVQKGSDGNAAGNRVWVRGTDGLMYGYFHMTDRDFGMVTVGQEVKAGDPLGRVGQTGRASGPHLHFEVRRGSLSGEQVNPETVLKGAAEVDVPDEAGAMDVDTFMDAISGTESGGNYGATNARTGASGKFQIMPGNWSAWAKEAGLSWKDLPTPQNQEKVARFKMQQYYKQFGSWEAVAVAWYAGPDKAALWVKNPNDPFFSRKHGKGNEPSVNEYIARVQSHGGGAGLGGTSRDSYGAPTTYVNTEVDPQARLEEQIRADNPGESQAHDIAAQYDQFRRMMGQSG